MKVVVITTARGPEVLQLQQVEDPELKEDEVLIKVEVTALNRADTLQRKGAHHPPKGARPYPGLECSGTVQAVGKNVSRWRVGDQVCILSGGGYAEKVAVPAGQVLSVQLGVSLKDAASLPEVALEAKAKGATVLETPGIEEKFAVCDKLGADVCINYKTEDFVARVKEETGGKGVDVILDCIGAAYLQRNVDSLNFDAPHSATDRDASRKPENKAMVVNEVEKNVWPEVVAGKLKPIVYKSFPLSEAGEGHKLMESNEHIGKILLVP
ncbi:Beta-galactosidase 8 [Hibiscus syriacus]|uniref:Beta-galactosidase 8 n=1 Tax=Hibiscus syriacus TaxID=106335 RepID=A0A6A3A7V3_HIBSY|nr:Beta-galactosidase 8 [Hibiscus syriacus]